MHILVHQALHQQQLADQPVGVGQHRTSQVARRIGGRQPHVALGIVGIVALPESDRSASDTRPEHLRRPQQRPADHISAVAPAIDAHTRAINVGAAGQEAHSLQLIVDLDMPQVTSDRGLESQATMSTAAVVDFQHHEALLSQILRS